MLRSFRATLKRAKLPLHIRFHDLRRSAGSLMLASGATLIDVSKILGHSSPAVTATVYSHAYDDNKRKAIAGVAAQLRDAMEGA